MVGVRRPRSDASWGNTLMGSLMLALVALSSQATTATAQTYQLMTDTPYHVSEPIRVQVQVPSVTTLVVAQSVLRLSGAADCSVRIGNDVPYTIGDKRPVSESTLPYKWNVQFTEADAAMPTDTITHSAQIYVCYSSNGGTGFAPIANQYGRNPFLVWTKIPTATLSQLSPTTGTAIGVTLHEDLFTDAAVVLADLQLLIVSTAAECQRASPNTIANAGAVTATRAATNGAITFSFPNNVAASNTAYFCMSTVTGGTVWSMIPYNDYRNTIAMYDGFTPRNSYEPLDNSFAILSSAERTFSLTCTPATPVAGQLATCDIRLMDGSSQASTSSSSLVIEELTDGAGVMVCPTPPLADNSGNARFTFTPKRNGGEGFLKLKSTTGTPYRAYATTSDTAYRAKKPAGSVDARRSYFAVAPGPNDVFPYSYAAPIAFSSFSNQASFATKTGVQWYPSKTLDVFEPSAMTLGSTVTTATAAYTYSTPSDAERCRVSVGYMFTGETAIDLQTNAFIGSIKVEAGVSGGTYTTMREYKLYSYLRYIVVTGGDGLEPGVLDGYIRTEELLTSDVALLTGWNSIRLSLTIDHTLNSKLYYVNPTIACSQTAASGSRTKSIATNAGDIAALNSIYTTLAAAQGTLTSWNAGGDPCRNQWRGVICRRNRVVELHLRFQKLTGVMPSLNAMTELEVIDVRDNSLSGTWNVGSALTNLRIVKITNNQITSILSGGTTFAHSGHVCLTDFQAGDNLISAFPTTGLTNLPQLTSFDISNNAMANTLPADWSAMTRLRAANVNRNALTGSLPTTIPTQPLVTLDFSNNLLTGNIPTSYTGFRNLQFFDVSHNKLSGKIPVSTLATIRTGQSTIFRASHNLFTYIPPKHHFRREGLRGNFFQCPSVLMREAVWLPYGTYYEDPMACDWQITAEE